MARRPSRRDANSFVCHLLNMGKTKYGDCLVVQRGGRTILIDGGHPGDYKDREDRPSIPAQLKTILGQEPPFHFDLLIVTHCHQDHIGCLPKLVAQGTITCDRALVADEKLGFGLDADGGSDARLTRVGARVRNLVAAMTEEDHSTLRGAELEEFLADAVLLQDSYSDMLQRLDRDTDVIRYRMGTAAEKRTVSDLVADMHETGLKIIGPTANQLVHCAEVLQRESGDAADWLADTSDASETLAEAYLRAMTNAAGADFSHEPGWAKNCQSIVLSFGDPDERILLPGDMQFAEPGIPAIENFVERLRADVAAGGPYVFVKMPHHTSHNGVNEDVLKEWGWPPLLGHSGGYNDPKHPYPETLELLKRLKRQHQFTYARTDRNGLITVEPARKDMEGEHSRLDDFTPNTSDDEAGPTTALTEIKPELRTEITAPLTSAPFVDITFVRIPYLDGRVSIDGRVIEISRPVATSREPTGAEFGRRQIEGVTKAINGDRRPALSGDSLGAGRQLPNLLFVTDLERLKQNIGDDADRALNLIRNAGHRIVTGPGPELAEMTRKALQQAQPKGVVLVGGYDVVPSQRVDVLDRDLRDRMPRELLRRDPDGFVVWSDDIYGDREPDGVPEVPVSRLPDARLGSFLISMLTNANTAQAGKFGLRNRERPFADAIYSAMSGTEPIIINAPRALAASEQHLVARKNVYFMLHGDYRNTGVFWGENDEGNTPAIDVKSLPQSGVGVAFAGCCWGALTVSEPAFLASDRPTPKMVERSMALSVLKAGAAAFVGATGVHYSPFDAEGSFFGGPLHSAFWEQIRQGRPPAVALFNARQTFATEIPHGRSALWNLAVERKLYKQFTCLGLGW